MILQPDAVTHLIQSEQLRQAIVRSHCGGRLYIQRGVPSTSRNVDQNVDSVQIWYGRTFETEGTN
jgi:hypothetical protein